MATYSSMLTFRNVNIAFAIIAVLCIAGNCFFHFPMYITLLLLVVYGLLLFYGSYYIGSGFYTKVICKGSSSKKQIALTFDDGPAVNYTLPILDILRRQNVQAAFFCIGNRIEGYEDIITQIDEGGHIIGNHSYSHGVWFDLMNAREMKGDLQLMSDELENITGKKTLFFRPPYGVTTPPMHKAVTALDYTVVGWNIRSLDTVIENEEKLLNKLKNLLKPGAIILLHDTCKTTMLILEQLIVFAKSQGYEFVRLDKLINKQAYA